jgi:adenosylmethionine-8-amino-7-oxononanoate aminotransferase
MGVCILSDTFDFENVDIRMGSTTAGNPISSAAAVASIKLLLESNKARQDIENQLSIISNIAIQHTLIYKVEHTGCFASLHFSQQKDKLKLFEYNIGGEVAKLCFKKGLIVRGNPKSIILAPGYYINADQFKFAIDVIMESVNELPN